MAQPEHLQPHEHLPAFLSFIMLLTAKNTATATKAITKMFTQLEASQSIIVLCLYLIPRLGRSYEEVD